MMAKIRVTVICAFLLRKVIVFFLHCDMAKRLYQVSSSAHTVLENKFLGLCFAIEEMNGLNFFRAGRQSSDLSSPNMGTGIFDSVIRTEKIVTQRPGLVVLYEVWVIFFLGCL